MELIREYVFSNTGGYKNGRLDYKRVLSFGGILFLCGIFCSNLLVFGKVCNFHLLTNEKF